MRLGSVHSRDAACQNFERGQKEKEGDMRGDMDVAPTHGCGEGINL